MNKPLGKFVRGWEDNIEVGLTVSVADFCEHGTEPSGCIEGGQFTNRPSDYQAFSNDPGVRANS